MRKRFVARLLGSAPSVAGAIALAMLAASPAMAETIESATTPFNVDKCPHRAGSEPEDGGVWRCKGFGGVPVVMAEGDIRVYVSFGPRALREPAASQTLGAPNGEGTSIEWRIARERDGKRRPFATIMRSTGMRAASAAARTSPSCWARRVPVSAARPAGRANLAHVPARPPMSNRVLASPVLAASLAAGGPSDAAELIESAYTHFDAKHCRHKPGTDVEDYGTWLCKGLGGIARTRATFAAAWTSARGSVILLSEGSA